VRVSDLPYLLQSNNMADIRRESPLFEEKMTLHTSSSSQEENETSLTLRILPGQRLHGSQQEKLLYFEVQFLSFIYIYIV
jgi:hypothetical protein